MGIIFGLGFDGSSQAKAEYLLPYGFVRLVQEPKR